ncbi:hypothetical protein PHYBOEH_003170 [Phytophthora boehmeriae]|uniref:WW domain-containing protein n=1 Tax=Phytophthora boehmeriae TaxID=109152 RepID=A0A8T1WVB0_9STRA|nr:hypothetical protein PHYBOEH_003170 [Phytophthora boehmeriae]
MRSFFSKRNVQGQQSRKRKQTEEVSADGVPVVFEGDESLLQLHAETAELLRLVKTPAKPAKRTIKLSAAGTPSKGGGKTRLTIEVLDDDDDEEENQSDTRDTAGQNSLSGERAQPPVPVDPSAFEAEEQRIRQAKDTFYPDMLPSKHGVEWQKNAYQREQNRQDNIRDKERQRAEQSTVKKQRRREQPLENRLETSAVVIQAHSRGFLCRRRRRKEMQAAMDATASTASSDPDPPSNQNEQWHEVRDVERGEVWYYNAATGLSQWEPPPGQAFSASASSTAATRLQSQLPSLTTNGCVRSPMARATNQRSSLGISPVKSLPPLSPATSSARSSSSDHNDQPVGPRRLNSVNSVKKLIKSPRNLPALQPEFITSSPNAWECDSVHPTGRSISSELGSGAATPGRYADSEAGDMDSAPFGPRRSLPIELDEDRDGSDGDQIVAFEDENSDWQTNDTLFRADGTKNSKLRDTIRSALHVSKFDSISSLIASNVVLRRKSIPGRGSRNQSSPAASGTRRREIVLGKRDEPVLVAVLVRDRDKRTKGGKGLPESPTRGSNIRSKAKAASRAGKPPHIRDLVDPGFHDNARTERQQDGEGANDSDDEAKEASRRYAASVCFNCWSSSNGRQCDLHQDPKDVNRKVRAAESALMCANWKLDQLRRKYRAEEIQEIFMKQRASLRYDKKTKQYVTVIECRHPMYRALENLNTAWNKTMRRKLHTRSWLRSFLEQLRSDRLPKMLGGARMHSISPTNDDAATNDLLLLEARRFPLNRPEQTGEEDANGFRTFWLVDAFVVPDDVPGVQVAPTSAILAPNIASMNATVTTRVDRSYPFCVPTTRENTPVEFIHLLWIGQSSRNQPQAFTTLGRQQPGDFMKNSDPDGALGSCSSVVYRSWAYMQDSPYDEFVTEDGVAYWYDRANGNTFWTRPVLPIEKFRGKDGGVDGVITTGEGEVATLGVGLGHAANGDTDAAKDGGAARYSQQNLRKYMTKKMEAPEDKERRVKLVTASAKKHDIVVDLSSEKSSLPIPDAKGELTRIQVPQLSLKRQQRNSAARRASSASSTKSRQVPRESTREADERDDPAMQPLDPNTKDMINSITQALGSALPALSQAGASKGSSVDMLQFGIGLGMGLGLRVQQQNASPTKPMQRGQGPPTTRSELSRKLRYGVHDLDEDDEEEEDEDDDDDTASTTRSDCSSVGTSLLSSRSGYSVAPSVDFSPTPDDVELNGKGPHVGKKTPGYQTHPPPGEGKSWVPKPVDSSGESQTAVDGFGGALHQRVACLPKDFVAAVTSTKTCKMQANYLPVIKNMNQPRSVGIVRPRRALEEWMTLEYSPWSAGRAVFATQFIGDLMLRPELIQQNLEGTASSTPTATKAEAPTKAAVEKRDAVSQAVKEKEQLDNIFSLCRHGKYDEVELLLNSPDWTLGIDAKDSTGNTLLSVACQNNNKRIAKLCMRRGADINTQNLNGQSLLHYCHEYGFHDLMEYLMEKGAKDDLLNADGLTCYEGLNQDAVDAI